jgi:hypothetical protein
MKTAMTTGNRFFRRRTDAKRKTRSVTRALLFTALAVTMAPCGAQQPGPHDAEFRAFYAEFVAAVRANDKNKLADLIAFPVKDWSVEHKGNVETIGIKDKAEFLANYNAFFTPLVHSHALKAKPAKVSDDRYTLIWQDADAEFSFEFEYTAPRGFRITSYGIGPR